MPATRFLCPSGEEVLIRKCLASCPSGTRCLLHPTLSAIAASTFRKLRHPSVTELIIGTREAYLKKTTDYAIDPQARLFALSGSAVHAAHAGQAEAFLAEARFCTCPGFSVRNFKLGCDKDRLWRRRFIA